MPSTSIYAKFAVAFFPNILYFHFATQYSQASTCGGITAGASTNADEGAISSTLQASRIAIGSGSIVHGNFGTYYRGGSTTIGQGFFVCFFHDVEFCGGSGIGTTFTNAVPPQRRTSVFRGVCSHVPRGP